MREQRAAKRIVAIDVSSTALRRRTRLERDIVGWLTHYFPAVFTYGLTPQQRMMAEAILTAARFGGDQAIAAPRGEGKTTITECVVIYCVLTGITTFPLILAATGPDAERILANIKAQFEDNDLLHEDYQEICEPARELQGAPNRAGSQLVAGKIGASQIVKARSRIKWSGRQIVLPTIKAKHSRAKGQIIATRGLDAAVRGIRYGTMRPDLAVIDDPETREVAESDTQPEKLEKKIDQDIAGLAGQRKRLARVMLTTLMNRTSVSATFTDATKKPSWKGRRFRLIEAWPERRDLWDEYITLRQAGQATGDGFGRKAHEFYLTHRSEMDAGGAVNNPHRYVADVMPDGTQQQVSTLQACFDLIADIGEASFQTEYQNDPPEETGPIESGITAHRIQKQVSGYDRQVLPPECILLTQGIDVRKIALHWVVRAWRTDGSGYVIDYGVHETHGTTYGSDEGVDKAVYRAILDRLEAFKDTPYATSDGAAVSMERFSLVDAGWRTDAVYAACREIGVGIMPVMGFGKSSGCTQANFHEVQRRTIDRKPGDGYFLSRRGKLWLVCADADRWKAWEHDRWMTAPGKPGSLQMFGQSCDKPDRLSDDEKSHHAYARHITNEIEIEEPHKGTLRRLWKAKSENTHWLDASYYSDVAAAMKGISVGSGGTTPKVKSTGPRPSLAALAGK